ncbi:MAG: aminotransferase class IV [bacterium]|nr:aminotransferase class IV [bacterium]
MSEPVVYLNTEFVPASKAHLNIYDLGIVLGATLTEMTRTFAHNPFRLEDHLARLYRSCKYAGIQLPLTQEEMHDRTLELIATNSKLIQPKEDLGIVHFVTPGENRIYAGSAAGNVRLTPTICIHSFPLPFNVWRPLFTEGAHVVTPSVRHVPPQCLDPKTKNRSRLHWWLADQQTHAVDPNAITLLLDLDGNITECSGSNFVLLSGNTVYSPTTRNILQGVSLLTVRELAEELGFTWVEKDLQPYDVANADEAWLTTTPYCIAPCTKFNNIPIGTGTPGPVFQKIIQAWSNRVGKDVLQQILAA